MTSLMPRVVTATERHARYAAIVRALEDIVGDPNETPARQRIAQEALDADRRTYSTTNFLAQVIDRPRIFGGLALRTQAIEEGWEQP